MICISPLLKWLHITWIGLMVLYLYFVIYIWFVEIAVRDFHTLTLTDSSWCFMFVMLQLLSCAEYCWYLYIGGSRGNGCHSYCPLNRPGMFPGLKIPQECHCSWRSASTSPHLWVRVTYFLKKVDHLFSNSPNLPRPAKMTVALPGGALTNFPCKLRLIFFSSTLGCRCSFRFFSHWQMKTHISIIRLSSF